MKLFYLLFIIVLFSSCCDDLVICDDANLSYSMDIPIIVDCDEFDFEVLDFEDLKHQDPKICTKIFVDHEPPVATVL